MSTNLSLSQCNCIHYNVHVKLIFVHTFRLNKFLAQIMLQVHNVASNSNTLVLVAFHLFLACTEMKKNSCSPLFYFISLRSSRTNSFFHFAAGLLIKFSVQTSLIESALKFMRTMSNKNEKVSKLFKNYQNSAFEVSSTCLYGFT